MREILNDKNKPDVVVQDSVGLLYNHMITNTPFVGGIGYYPSFGYIGDVNYRPLNIVLVQSDELQPDYVSKRKIDELLANANFLTNIGSLLTTGVGMLQANECFFIDDAGNFVKTSSDLGGRAVAHAADIAKISKEIGRKLSIINTGITAIQIQRNGLNMNNGADMVMCLVSFIPKIGWVISGIYFLTCTIVKEVTGEHPVDIANRWVAKKFAQLEMELRRVFERQFLRAYGY